ncbi:MAG: hypothetical protein RLZZ293_110 [Pseudomonadota bacterium]
MYIAKSTEHLNIRWSHPLEGKHSSITIAKDCADRYSVSFCSELEIKSLPKVDKIVGIDLGLTDFLVTLYGEKVKPLNALIK